MGQVRLKPDTTYVFSVSPGWSTTSEVPVVSGFSLTHRLGQAEVEHLHLAICSNLDVRGLQIAMDDALFVRRFKRVRIHWGIHTACGLHRRW